nr:PREDICTED: microtubule-associated protein RP/EB family member 1-like [Bemisia tabaci]
MKLFDFSFQGKGKQGGSWTLIEFLDSQENPCFDAVPDKWLNTEKTECYYPDPDQTTTKDLNALALKCETPESPLAPGVTWITLQNIKVVKGPYSNFEDCKLDMVRVTKQKRTAEESEAETAKKRPRKENKKFSFSQPPLSFPILPSNSAHKATKTKPKTNENPVLIKIPISSAEVDIFSGLKGVPKTKQAPKGAPKMKPKPSTNEKPSLAIPGEKPKAPNPKLSTPKPSQSSSANSGEKPKAPNPKLSTQKPSQSSSANSGEKPQAPNPKLSTQKPSQSSSANSGEKPKAPNPKLSTQKPSQSSSANSGEKPKAPNPKLSTQKPSQSSLTATLNNPSSKGAATLESLEERMSQYEMLAADRQNEVMKKLADISETQEKIMKTVVELRTCSLASPAPKVMAPKRIIKDEDIDVDLLENLPLERNRDIRVLNESLKDPSVKDKFIATLIHHKIKKPLLYPNHTARSAMSHLISRRKTSLFTWDGKKRGGVAKVAFKNLQLKDVVMEITKYHHQNQVDEGAVAYSIGQWFSQETNKYKNESNVSVGSDQELEDSSDDQDEEDDDDVEVDQDDLNGVHGDNQEVNNHDDNQEVNNHDDNQEVNNHDDNQEVNNHDDNQEVNNHDDGDNVEDISQRDNQDNDLILVENADRSDNGTDDETNDGDDETNDDDNEDSRMKLNE